jgi:predicted component of type VI protein secretion system
VIVGTIRTKLQALAERCSGLDALLHNLPESELRELPDALNVEAARLLVALEKAGKVLDRIGGQAEGLHEKLSTPLFDRKQGRRKGRRE